MFDRRRLRWIAPLLLLGLWLTGCGNDTGSTPESDNTSAPAASEKPKTDDQPPKPELLKSDSAKPDADSIGDAKHATPASGATQAAPTDAQGGTGAHGGTGASADAKLDFMSMLFVFMLATFIGIGVIRRVSRLLHTPLMSLTNAISAIAVVGSIMVTGSTHYPGWIRFMGGVALFASMTNIVSGFLITDRMLKMFKTREAGK